MSILRDHLNNLAALGEKEGSDPCVGADRVFQPEVQADAQTVSTPGQSGWLPEPRGLTDGVRRAYQPCLVVLCGPPLHGKTTMAAALKEHSNFIHIDVDEIRRQHFPSTSGALLPKEAELDLMACCYAFSMETAMTFIRKGLPVVFSGTCSREAFKRPVVRFLHDHGNEFPIRLFRLDVASDAVIRDRILARAATASPSPIRDEAQYRWALSIADPWPAEVEVTPVDAGRDPGIIADQLRQHLAPLRVEPSPPEPTLGDGAHEKALVRRL